MLSLITVIKDEEARLPGMLDWHLPWVDECIVVHDGPCADASLKIAQERGCIVIEAPFHGYCEPLRELGLKHSTGDWALFVDADEKFPIELLTIAREISRKAEFDAVMLPRITQWPDWPDKGAVHDFQTRLLRKATALISPVIHTSPATSGVTVRFDWAIQHTNLLADIQEKKDRYRQIINAQLAQVKVIDVRKGWENNPIAMHLERCLQEMDG